MVNKIINSLPQYITRLCVTATTPTSVMECNKYQKIFSEVYSKGLWGRSNDPTQQFYSGKGSHDNNITSVYLYNVSEYLKNMKNKPNVVDLGCGDFNIGSQIRQFCNKYIACDIVNDLVEYNKNKYKNLSVDFRLLDIVTDQLPDGDIVFIRQVLQHLSNESINKIIPKLYQNYRALVLTEHLPLNEFNPNIDKPDGAEIRLDINSGIVLTEKPFNLQVLEENIICEAKGYGGVIRTTIYRLK